MSVRKFQYIDRMVRPVQRETMEQEIRSEAQVLWDSCLDVRKRYPNFKHFAHDLLENKLDLQSIESQ